MNPIVTSAAVALAQFVQSSAPSIIGPLEVVEIHVNSPSQCEASSEDVSSAPQDMYRMKWEILCAVTKEPRLDDEEVASRLGVPTFDVSVLLREMEREGLVSAR